LNFIHVLFYFGRFKAVLTHVVVDHPDPIPDFFICEVLDALTNFCKDG
jgi:hypothetical protein